MRAAIPDWSTGCEIQSAKYRVRTLMGEGYLGDFLLENSANPLDFLGNKQKPNAYGYGLKLTCLNLLFNVLR